MKYIYIALIVQLICSNNIKGQNLIDTTVLYNNVLANIQLYQSQRLIERESINIGKGEIDKDLFYLLQDTNMCYELTFKNLGYALSDDTNYILISYKFPGILYTRDRYWMSHLDLRMYNFQLVEHGLILYNRNINKIYYMSGDVFLSNTLFLFKLFCRHYTWEEAVKLYASLRLFNYLPKELKVENKHIYFYSEALKKKCQLKIAQLVNWQKFGKIDVICEEK